MQRQFLAALAGTAALCAWAAPQPAGAVLIVDFAFDDSGSALGNGQIIDTEFFTHFTITSPETGVSHLGPTIFDSTAGGPNASGADPDLLVDLGNVLILQNTAYSSPSISSTSTAAPWSTSRSPTPAAGPARITCPNGGPMTSPSRPPLTGSVRST
jgi:hypothetical protein